MRVTLWGTRGSLPAPGPETARYGGNTPCVQVCGEDGTVLVLDAGSGIRRLGASLAGALSRVDLLLTHLHMDHVQGLGFFAPLYDPAVEVHIWGPASLTLHLWSRLSRYLSPPLFPIRLRDLPRPPVLHDVPCGEFSIGPFVIDSMLICHPGPTVGYRIAADGAALTYLPDHEPALGVPEFPSSPDWTSGCALAAGADLLIHDAQFSAAEYPTRVGWGHSALPQTLAFASLAQVRHLVLFHHDPDHTDADLDRLTEQAVAAHGPVYPVTIAAEGMAFTLSAEQRAARLEPSSPGPPARRAPAAGPRARSAG
jgi:phosphoribosyl 1,2-cyclic phosphodiesterase